MNESIVRLAARGDGVSESGRFVSGAVPGDSIDNAGTVIPGPNRLAPACKHFGTCGGCQLQHVSDEIYSAWIVNRVADALKAQGLDAPEMQAPHLSPPGSRRRVSLRALQQGKSVLLGFAEGGSHRLVDLGECPIMRPELWALIAPLRALLGRALIERRQSDVRMTLADQGVDLMIAGVSGDGLAATSALIDFAQEHQLARLSINEAHGAEIVWEPEPVTITLGGIAVPFPEGAFLQATSDGEAALVAAVRETIGVPAHMADLFAGLGTFAFSLAGKVHAVEGARNAVQALQSAANRAQRPISTEHRDLFRRPLTAKELAKFDCVLLDPPRAGAKEQIAEIARSTVPAIAYVSCNPATFGRDAKMLIDGGYRLNWIKPVGQFRWSTHVELAARFNRL